MRIHTGREAAGLSSQIQAKAFTHGNDIYFNSGEYNPNSSTGKSLLAHELTHTIQQGAAPVQRQDDALTQTNSILQEEENKTGLPDNLKSGMETLSGMSLDDVKVHRNSDKPSQLQAQAQGTDIHLGPGQEKHFPHEAWHVVQQKQGRVKPTIQMKGKVSANDDAGLEKEVDEMGVKASRFSSNHSEAMTQRKLQKMANNSHSQQVIQRDACLIPGNKNSPYAGIKKTGNVGPGESFDSNQRFAILSANFVRMGKATLAVKGTLDIQQDDLTGQKLLDPGNLKPHIAEVDHIVPKSIGGGNTELNAQVISGSTNASKGDTYPHGGYKNFRIYDPAQQKVYNSKSAAQSGGADLTTLNAKGWI